MLDIESQPSEVVRSLGAEGVVAVALTIVDNAGIARVKTVPVAGLERAARWGVGLAPIFNVCLVDDSFTATRVVGGPTGDLRLVPDLAALRLIGGESGWAWAPADQHTQDGEVFGCCQRSFLRQTVDEARRRGFEFRVGSELEWFLGHAGDGGADPVHDGPAYGLATLSAVSNYASELIAAFLESSIEINQFHPEYAPGQFELSLRSADPIDAADLSVIARHLIRSVSTRHGLRSSFAPVVASDQVGNGGHLHFSVWASGCNLLAGGPGPHGMTDDGEAFIAGVLAELPALVAVGMPSVASYLRQRPSRWAGAYACWGLENREAALRFVTGMKGTEPESANCEVKCFDATANPYLAIGAVISAGLAGVERGLKLPPAVVDDPACAVESMWSHGAERLPISLEASCSALERSDVLRSAMGPMLFDAFLTVRRAEWEAFGQDDPEALAAVHRWRY